MMFGLGLAFQGSSVGRTTRTAQLLCHQAGESSFKKEADSIQLKSSIKHETILIFLEAKYLQ